MNASKDKPWANLNILVAEDDVVSRMLLKSILDECDIKATFARHGKEAVDFIKEDDSFDLILMDLRMPIMDGIQATKEIRELGFTKPIVALTAFVSKEDMDNALSNGFDEFMAKPLRMPKLLDTFQRILKK